MVDRRDVSTVVGPELARGLRTLRLTFQAASELGPYTNSQEPFHGAH
jgi:hypothetical protein